MIYELPKIPGIGEEQQGPDCETVYASGYTAGYTSGYSDGYDSVECEDASYFAIEVVSGGTIAWDNNQSSYDEDNSTCYLKYRINGGEWGTLVNNIKHEPEGVVSAFTVNSGDVVEFGTNSINWNMVRSTDKHYRFVFSQGMKCKLEGNIMSLIYPEGEFETATEFPYDEYGYEKTNWFEGLFLREEGLGDAIIDAGNLLLPATALTSNCYAKMFRGCTSLVTPPALPAITLANRCYERMFFGCTSLTTAPELPATALANTCYRYMFYNCTSLTTAPSTLPATTLANECYSSMFAGCTSLRTAPEKLPATTLANSCYFDMFRDCASLTVAPELPATTLAEYCYHAMFRGCTSITTAPELPATTLAESCYDCMFSACTSLVNVQTVLPATVLKSNCYANMFYACSSLERAPELPATNYAAGYAGAYANMFSNCSSLNYVKCMLLNGLEGYDPIYLGENWISGSNAGTFVKHPNATWRLYSTGGVPIGWTVVDAS